MQIFEGDMNQCYGCKACEQICPSKSITMLPNMEGFYYPSVDSDTCINCHLCQKVCAVNLSPSFERSSLPDTYASWNLNRDVLEKSSSGGVFTALAEEVLKQGGVVFGASMDENLCVRHIGVTSMSDLDLLRGSKYIQSDINTTFKEVKKYLSEEQHVLFTGTPCQIAGLYGFLRSDKKGLVTCEVVCHGVPSQLGFDKYKQKVEISKKGMLTHFTFRDTRIWSYQSRCCINGKKKLLFGKNDFYMKSFFKSYTFRESCYTCKYASLPRIADITIADFWGIGEMIPFAKRQKRGISLILVNSKKGNELLFKAKACLFLEKRELSEAVRRNHNIITPSQRPNERDDFYKDFNLPLDKIVSKYNLKPTLRNYIGFLKRRLLNVYISLCK